MAVYKDKQRGTWYVSVYYTNWKGESDRKVKRGFKTRKDAVAWENTFLNKNAGDLNMTFAEFYDIYKSDLEERLKENTWVMKESVIELKILPYFKKKKIYKKVSNTEKLASLIIKVIKIWGIIILACLIVAVVGIVLFGFVRGEGSVEFENNVEKVTFTEVVGEETYVITIGSDGYFEGFGMSDEIKEELMELIVVGDLPTSEDNITDYFIKLREGTQQETP